MDQQTDTDPWVIGICVQREGWLRYAVWLPCFFSQPRQLAIDTTQVLATL